MEIQLQERLIKYAMAHMREAIHNTQSKIIDLEQRAEFFPESALSAFGAQLGRPNSLEHEADGTRSELNDAKLRLGVLESDYEVVQDAWQEVKDRDMREAVKQFWEQAK